MPDTISIGQLKTQLGQGAVSPLYLLLGEEDLLRDSALAEVKRAVLETEGDDFNCDIFYGDEAEATRIVSCASEIAVFAARRLVIVRLAEKLSAKQGEVLLPYLEAPNESTTAVFVASKLDGRLRFAQALAKLSVVVDCGPLKEGQLIPWLKQEADRVSVRVDDDALHMLKEACGGSLYSVRREMEKLASYVPAGRAATIDDVAILRGIEPGASVFDLAAAIGAKNRGKALAILARNLEAGEAPLRILGSLAWQYRRLWKVKESIQRGGREGEAARSLRMDPYKVRAFLGQFSESHLRDALQEFLVIDSQLKGGSAGKPAVLLDRLILRLCVRPLESGHAGIATVPAAKAVQRTKPLSNVRTISSKRPRS